MKFYNQIFKSAILGALLTLFVGCDCASQKSAAEAEPLTDYSSLKLEAAPMQDGKYICQRPAQE